MREGKREIRALNDPCDASCAVWFACANSKPDGVCNGFALMNGETRKHLNRILNDDDAIYVQKCAHMAQSECPEETREAMVQEVLRYIPPKEPQRQGFLAMLEASRPSNPSAPQEPQPEERASSGFSAMLRASAKGEQTEDHPPIERQTVIQRQIDFETQLPLICVERCPIKRHCSSFPSNEGHVCVKQTEQYKNKYMVRSMMKDEDR